MANIKIEIKKGKKLSREEKTLMNNWRIKEFGSEKIEYLEKFYSPSADVFFVKIKNKTSAFGLLIPTKIRYLEKTYDILGISCIISLEKRKGYGKILINAMTNYIKKKNRIGLGFCERKNIIFYENSGLKVAEGLMKRFKYRYATSKEKSDEGDEDVVYVNDKNNFIKKII